LRFFVLDKRLIFFVFVLLCIVAALSACEMPGTPTPTPTPTRTPILPTATPTPTPTMTPTPTPTITPTPTPTLPPGLILPVQATEPQGWPPLPVELYFLREGRIWVWLGEGGALDAIPVTDEEHAVLAYRVTPDNRFVLYVTDSGRLYSFDRALWEHTYIPTAGRLIEPSAEPPGIDFAVTADGQYLVYLAWGVQSSAGITGEFPYGTLLAIDLTNVRLAQQELGFCNSTADAQCTGLALAPDGSHVVYEDGAGLWLAAFDNPEPRLVMPFTKDSGWRFLAWAPNGRWLILKAQSEHGATLALFNIATTQLLPIDVPCSENCRLELSWGAQSIWVSADTPEYGCLYEVQPDVGGNALEITYEKCLVGPWGLHPTSPQALPDGWVAFVHRGCGMDCNGPGPGLYFLGPDETTHPIALLDTAEGSALWTADASAFLYFDPEGVPTHLGVTDTVEFWDVRRALDGAHIFQWGVDGSQ